MELLNLDDYKAEIHRTLISKLDLEKLSRVNSSQARQAVSGLVKEIMSDQRVPLNFDEQERIHSDLLDEVFGLGPLEPLLREESSQLAGEQDIDVGGQNKTAARPANADIFADHLVEGKRYGVLVAAVQFQIREAEAELAHLCIRCAKIAGPQHFLEQILGNSLARLIMPRK